MAEFQPHLQHGRSRAAFVGVFWSSLHTLIPTISGAAVFFISAYYLSPADFGLVGLAAGFVSFALAFSPVAFGEALVQRQNITRSHADTVFWLTAVFGLVFFLAFLLGAGIAADYLNQPAMAAMLPILALRIPFTLLAIVPNSMIIRTMQFKLVALRTSVATIISAIISVSMLLAGYGYWALVASQVSAAIVICIMAFWVTGWRPKGNFSVQALKDLFSYGIFASGDRMLNDMKLDHIILGILGGTGLLGFYYFAQRLYGMLRDLVSGALSSVSMSLMSTLQNDKQKLRDAYFLASFASCAFSFPMFVGLALVADDLLPLLLEPKWAAAAFALKAFCLIGLVASIGVVQFALVKSQGRANWWFYYQLIQHSATVLVILATVDAGLPTMMALLVVKTYLFAPIIAFMSAKLLDYEIRGYLLEFKGPAFATAIMAAAVYIVPLIFPALAVRVYLPLQILTGVVVYSASLLAISHERIANIRQILRSKAMKKS